MANREAPVAVFQSRISQVPRIGDREGGLWGRRHVVSPNQARYICQNWSIQAGYVSARNQIRLPAEPDNGEAARQQKVVAKIGIRLRIWLRRGPVEQPDGVLSSPIRGLEQDSAIAPRRAAGRTVLLCQPNTRAVARKANKTKTSIYPRAVKAINTSSRPPSSGESVTQADATAGRNWPLGDRPLECTAPSLAHRLVGGSRA